MRHTLLALSWLTIGCALARPTLGFGTMGGTHAKELHPESGTRGCTRPEIGNGADFDKTLTPNAPLKTIFRTGLTFRVRVDGAPKEA